MATIFVLFYFFFCSGMLINTVPDDCLVYIGFNWVLIFNITSIVNVFMLSIKKSDWRLSVSEYQELLGT